MRAGWAYSWLGVRWTPADTAVWKSIGRGVAAVVLLVVRISVTIWLLVLTIVFVALLGWRVWDLIRWLGT